MQTLATGFERQISSGASYSRLLLTQPALKIVALGDSLIYGYGDPDGGGWVERLRRTWMLPDSPGHVLYNLGVRGDKVQQVAQRIEYEFRNRGELRHRVPDLIILSVGVNDSARLGHVTGRNFTDFETFQLDIANLLDQAQQLCPVLFVGMTPVDEKQMPFENCLHYNHADQYRYKEATRLACFDRQIPYLDIFERWLAQGDLEWRSRLSSDGLHPNTAGYQSLLQDVLSWEPISQGLNQPLTTP
ncbi:G-D-S-L family lipolytic protein [Oculatella sp. LEGE 06141]|uniref:GDSL-type esterase/lipase family protein n=1 Tax=Oculatella sp. LEGE 06141 TaxID=1828648 RepID=UPI00187F2B2C|nr:GDSL-type esterase/lipase family protein [Oculatella sp. LEGE 06141]MBE9182370.1 G-D-S-L family lipolytic protein [Oculatella sp. LEGE 06141]